MKKFVFFLLIVVCSLRASAQIKIETKELNDLFKPKPKADYSKYLKESKNSLDGTFSLLFVGYKAFFSSQDMDMCVFHPSCSVYAIETLKNEPIYYSYFKVMDRLQRCHPFVTPGQYKINSKTGRFYDPVFYK